MSSCRYIITDKSGKEYTFNSEEELDDFILEKKDFLKKAGFTNDMVYSRRPNALRARNIILEQKAKAESMEAEFRRAIQNAKDLDSETMLMPDPPYVGVTKFLDGRRNSAGNLLTPEFIEDNYWDDRISHWTSAIPSGKSITDMFNSSEIKMLAEGKDDNERYDNFLKARTTSGTYQPLSQKEAENLQKAIKKKWSIVNREGTAIHFVMQQYFSELTDENGNPLERNGKTLHVFDLRDTPQDGLPTIQNYIMDKVYTELKSNMGRKYSDDLITPQLLSQLLNYAENLHRHIQKLIPGDLEFFPELKITGDLHNVSEGPQKLMGILDLVVLDQYGTPHIFDYKCSDKKYSEFSEAKKRGFYYQQAIYNRLLRQHGLNTNRTGIRILPITLNNFRCTNIDEVLVNPDNIQFTYDNIYYPPGDNQSVDIKLNINGVGADGSSKIIDNIDEFLPEEKIEDATSDGAISFVTKMMSKFFPDYTYNNSSEDIEQEVKEQGGFEKASDGLYHFRVSTNKEVTSSDPKDLLDKVVKERDKQNKRKASLAETAIQALQYAQENDTKDIQDILKYIDTKYLDDDKAFQGWFKNYLQRYCNSDWQVIPSESARQFGIIMLRNKITNQIDVLKMSAYNLKGIRRLKGNKNNIITRAFETDVEEKSNNKSRILQDAEGNRELIETMLFLNTVPTLFSGTYNGAVVGNIEVINPFKGQGLQASNEELLYSFNKLKEYAPIEGTDNISNGNVKFGQKWQLLQNELAAIVDDSSSYNMSKNKEVFQTCQNEIQSLIAGSNNEQKIKALLKLIKELERVYNIDQLSSNQLNSETNESPAYRLYYNALITLGELRGLKFRQQLKESAKWLEGGIGNALSNGVTGVYIDNPGNLASETLNSITALHTQALQNVRRDMQEPIAKLRQLTEKLKKEKNYGYVTSLVKNDIELYKNMMFVDSNGDLRFTNINDAKLSSTEKEYLTYVLKLINKNRFNTFTDETLDKMANEDDIRYYRVPLCRAERQDERDANIKQKVGENGEMEEYSTSLWKSFVDTLKAFNPKQALKDIQEKVNGVFTEDSDAYKSTQQLFNLTTMFDANEPDAAGNNLQDRLENIATKGTGYFEQNIETLALKHMFAYSTKNRVNEIMPTVKAGMAFLINMGNSQNTNFENDVKYFEDYIKNKIKGQPLEQDPILGSSKKSQEVKAATMKIRSVASFMALAFSPIQWVGQRIQGIFNDISLIIRKPDGTNAFTFKNMFDAYKEVNKDLFHYSDKPTKCQLINELYGINDMDMNTYAEKLRTDKHGLFNLNELAFKFVSRPDFYNRMTIIVAQMKAQGVWDALEVHNGKLVYNYKKDKRFSVYANGDTSNPEYNKQKSLYYAIAQQFVDEEVHNPDGSLFEIGQDLPAAYTNKEMESMKSLCDLIYGYYNNEKKSMIHATFLGGLFMQMKTYWSGKKNQYLNPGGVRIMGHWEQLKDAEGNDLYYQTDEEGHINRDVPPVPKEQVLNQDMLIPFTQWKGQWQEGIVMTIANSIRASFNSDDAKWYNPFTWGHAASNYKEYMKNMDPNMKVTYRQNIRQLNVDLFVWMVLGCLLGGMLADRDKEIMKDAKDTGQFSDAVMATMYNIFAKSEKFATDDFNMVSSVGNPIIEWNPFAITTAASTIKRVFNIMTGDNSAYQNLVNTFTVTKAVKPIMNYIAPDGGYIFPREEE